MRCYICDVALSEPHWNCDHQDYEPCDFCLSVINDLLDGWKDQPFAEEEDFGEDGTVADLFRLWDRIVRESLYG